MSSSPVISRRTLTSAAIWSAPVIAAAIAAPQAAASTERLNLAVGQGGLGNGYQDHFDGGFAASTNGSDQAAPVTDITAYVTLGPNTDTAYSGFTTDLGDGWVLVQGLGDGEPGTFILAWQADPGLNAGETTSRVTFEFDQTSGPRTNQCTITLISPTANTTTQTILASAA